jgi:hypothetical protein
MNPPSHPSPASNSLPMAIVEWLAEHAVNVAKWALALFMGAGALAYLMIAGMKDE